MDDAPSAGPFVAQAVAAAAATFRVPSAEIPAGVAHVLPYCVVAGGLPLEEGGALGIAVIE